MRKHYEEQTPWFLYLCLLVGSTVFGTMFALGVTGCVTPEDLDPEGVYDSSAVLYNADTAIVTGYDLMDNFLKWEQENRAAFSSVPEVKAAADHIRANGKRWITTAIALREAYALEPTSENQAALQSALTVIRTALVEATKYMASTPPS